MTATNHALSGALIGLAVMQPILALPLAFVSHFMLDAVPHFGFDEHGGHLKNKKTFHKVLYVDALFLVVIFVGLFALNAPLLAFVCAVVAGSPDLIWAYRYVFKEKFGTVTAPPKNIFNRFHSRIQTSQTFRGLYIEVPLALIFLSLIIQKI